MLFRMRTINSKRLVTSMVSFSIFIKLFCWENLSVIIGGIYLTYAPIWIPVDAELVKRIACNDFSHFTAHGFFFRHKNDILSNNLFNSEGAEWKHLRAKLTPAFSSAKLKLMFVLIDKLGDRLESQSKHPYHLVVLKFILFSLIQLKICTNKTNPSIWKTHQRVS